MPGKPAVHSPVIYEIFVRNHTPEGTIQALIPDLPRIRELGTDIVWLMPIYPVGETGRKGSLGSPYSIKDYRAIEPSVGNFRDFEKLAEAVHKLGMKLMMDFVFNHTSNDSELVRKKPGWFYKWNGQIARKIPDWGDISDFDYNSDRELNLYLIETIRFWLNKGVDGLRCDVASLVPLRFWMQARTEIDPECSQIWLAESISKEFIRGLRRYGHEAASDPELHNVFDITYDYDGFEYLQDYFKGSGTMKSYLSYLTVQETLYPAGASKLRFLENHDVPRIAGLFRDAFTLQNWTMFYLMLPGANLVYAGQEYAMKDQPSLFEKDPVNWKEKDEEFNLFFKSAVALSKRIKQECAYADVLEIAAGVIRIEWKGGSKTYHIYVNLENRTGIYKATDSAPGRDIRSGRRLSGELQLQEMPFVVER